MSRIPYFSRTGALTTTPSVIALPQDWSELRLVVDARCYARVGPEASAPGVATTAGVITISEYGSPTGGVFRVRLHPADLAQAVETADIAYNASAAAIKSAMTATGAIATGDFTAAGGALPTNVTLTFSGGAWVGVLPGLEISEVALTGGDGQSNVRAVVTTAPKPNGGYGYVEATTTPNLITRDGGEGKRARFLHLAAVATTANYFLSAFK